MGCSLRKRLKNEDVKGTICDCQRSNMREAVFRSMERMLSYQPADAQYPMAAFFCLIFELNNTKCNRTCSDIWITIENITEAETKKVYDILIAFSEHFIDVPEIGFMAFERDVLTGMVIFRTQLLPVFRETINDDTVMIPFLLRLLHWERVIRRRLSEAPEGELIQPLDFMQSGQLSEHLKRAYKWWNVDFKDTEEMDAAREYLLTD